MGSVCAPKEDTDFVQSLPNYAELAVERDHGGYTNSAAEDKLRAVRLKQLIARPDREHINDDR